MNERIFTPDKRIRIFLSSRIPEFTAERHALVRMIQKMGYTPVFFEETARPHPPRDLYSAYLRQSHILVLRCFQWNRPGCLGSIGGCNLSKCSSGC